ncbi:MAG: glycosyltransferase [Coriobacteriales bacterium]|nr:glycosyltransferase [Coriobacteriales bacterium]
MPKASIIMPCYNAEKYLAQSLDTALAQTMGDLEVICVNDGSTDGTLEVLNEYAARDARVRVIDQPNGGEGVARDHGRELATGEWLAFLDADDLLEPTMLEDSISCGEATNADVVVFQTILLNNQTGEQSVCDWAFRHDWIDGMVFCPRENPSRIFNSFQNWACTKLFRRSFVDEHGLYFQHIHRTADLLFTCRALAEADTIALLDKPLYQYRVNNLSSAINTSDSYPLDFYHAFVALREALEEHDLWDLYHDSFVSWAREGIAVNLQLCRSLEGFQTIANEVRDHGFELLDIGFDAAPSADSDLGECICYSIATKDNLGLLFDLFLEEKQHSRNSDTVSSELRLHINERNEVIDKFIADIDELQACIKATDADRNRLRGNLEDIRGSKSYKVGRALTTPARVAKKVIRKRKR